MADVRLSKQQKLVLLILAAAFTKGVKSIESPDLRYIVELKEGANVDKSNFQKSLTKLLDNGYVMKEKIVHEAWYNITPLGFEKAIELRG